MTIPTDLYRSLQQEILGITEKREIATEKEFNFHPDFHNKRLRLDL